jgi:hypothetical protein
LIDVSRIARCKRLFNFSLEAFFRYSLISSARAFKDAINTKIQFGAIDLEYFPEFGD